MKHTMTSPVPVTLSQEGKWMLAWAGSPITIDFGHLGKVFVIYDHGDGSIVIRPDKTGLLSELLASYDSALSILDVILHVVEMAAKYSATEECSAYVQETQAQT